MNRVRLAGMLSAQPAGEGRLGIGRPLVLLALILVLAGLDMIGALLAKEYADQHRPPIFLFGALTFLALFAVYAYALKLAQLSIVTMGWIVLLEVGLLAVDYRRAAVSLNRGQWAAVAVILVLQCYLVLSTGSRAARDAESAPVLVKMANAIPTPRTDDVGATFPLPTWP